MTRPSDGQMIRERKGTMMTTQATERLPRSAVQPGQGAPRRGRPRSALMVLAILLASSSAVRVGGSSFAPVRAAMAQGLSAASDAGAPVVSAPAEQEARLVPAAAAIAPTDARGIEALIEALASREAELDAREEALERRTAREEQRLSEGMARLTDVRAQVEGMLAELEGSEARLDAAIARAAGAAEDDLGQLTTVYETMKSKDAARLFEQMEPEFAAGFLGRMRPEAAAEVMAGLTAERAYAVSAVLAGRNARLNVPPQAAAMAAAASDGEGAP